MNRLLPAPLLVAALALPFAACKSTPPLPDGGGPGLVAFDPAAPASTQVYQRPEWRVGDTFAMLRGGKQRLEFTVMAADADTYTLQDQHGNRMVRGRDLSNVGEWPAEGDEPTHVLTPPDVRFHWPLWVGKRWRCKYSDRTAGGRALPIESAYEVEDLDTIETPGGTFPALRIVRTSRLELEQGNYADRVMLIWYAPDLGLEVRQVLGDTAIELVEWTRAAAPAGGD
ncbi:MAG: hypothetical protein AB7O97_02215 [Planctomycetota bacterium]